MLVNIENSKLEDGVVVCSKADGGFKIVRMSDFLAPIEVRLKNLENACQKAQESLTIIDNLHIIDKVNECNKLMTNDVAKKNLIVACAFLMLNQKINFTGCDYPEDFNDCEKFVNDLCDGKVTSDDVAPKSLQPFIKALASNDEKGDE